MEFIQLVALASFMGVLVGLALYVVMMNKQQGQQKSQQEPDEAAQVEQVPPTLQMSYIRLHRCYSAMMSNLSFLHQWSPGHYLL